MYNEGERGAEQEKHCGAGESMIMSQQKRVQMGERRDLGNMESLFQIKNCIFIMGCSGLVRPSTGRGPPCGIKEFNGIRDNHGMPRRCPNTNTGTSLHSVFLTKSFNGK